MKKDQSNRLNQQTRMAILYVDVYGELHIPHDFHEHMKRVKAEDIIWTSKLGGDFSGKVIASDL